MFTLDVVLVGCRGEVLESLRGELARLAVHIEAEYPEARGLHESLRGRDDWAARTGGGERGRRLYIVHPKSARDPYELRMLSEALPGQPVLVLLPTGTDQTGVLAALREGATQVALLPLQSDDFRAALDSIGRQFSPSPSGGKVVAVTGATGGAGATTVAINLAFEMACTQKSRCLLADLSLNMGVVASYLDVAPQGTIQDLLREGERLGSYAVQKALTQVADGLHILAGPHESVAPGLASPEDILRVVRVARRVTPLLILDVPCSYDELHFAALAQADQVVLVAQQSVPSVRAVKLILEALDRRGAGSRRILALNRYDPHAEGFTAAELGRLLGVAEVRTIANDWAALTRAQNHGRPLLQEAPRSPALQDVRALAAALTGRENRVPRGASGFFTRVREAFRT